jgi:predicted membrane channel-forming protein YqfA (hemolysin III family)
MVVLEHMGIHMILANSQLSALAYGYYREQFTAIIDYLILMSITVWSFVAFTVVMRWSARLYYLRRKQESR